MKYTKGRILESIEKNIHYVGCTFYLNENMVFDIGRNRFDNCSFRTPFSVNDVDWCNFQNCGFCSDFILRPIDDPGISFAKSDLKPYVTKLDLRNFDQFVLCENFFVFESLEKIDISGSNFIYISLRILNLKRLSEINVKNTPISLYLDNNFYDGLPECLIDGTQNCITLENQSIVWFSNQEQKSTRKIWYENECIFLGRINE